VCDFGLAVAVGRPGARVGGTPHFMAPEQFADDGASLTSAADVYGIGALLYQVLVGVPPFARLEGESLHRAVRHEDPPSPHSLLRVPRELSAIAMRALARAPVDRYRDGDELASDLEAWLCGAPVQARPAPWPVRTWRAMRRRPAMAGFVLAAGLALLALATFAWSRFERMSLRTQMSSRMQQAAELGLDAVLRLRRAGDIPGMTALAAPVASACSEVLAAFPDEGRPHLVLAMLHRATMQFEAARRHVDLAAARLPDDPDVRFERGMLTLHFAFLARQREREAAQRQELWRGAGGWARARWQALFGDPEELDRDAIEVAIADLRASGRSQARCLVAALSGPGRFAGFDLQPADASAGDADVFVWLATAAMVRGDGAAAEAWATLGNKLDRGCSRHLLLRAAARLQVARSAHGRSAVPADVADAIDQDLGAAAALQPLDADLQERCGVVWLCLDEAAAAPGGTSLEHAVLALAKATAQDPHVAERWHGLAIARLRIAEQCGLRSDAAGTTLAQAREDLDQALALDPDRAAFHESAGHLHIALQRRSPRAATSTEAHAAAMCAFDRASVLAPRHVGPHIGRALSLRLAGQRELAVATLEAALLAMPDCEPLVRPILERMRR
jgi:tetratricopeptide (TPR) repeat protein